MARTAFFVLTLLSIVGFAYGQSLVMKEGNQCVPVQFETCVACNNGNNGNSTAGYRMCTRFETGRVGCGWYETASCDYQVQFSYEAPAPCFALSNCDIVPSSFVLFSVMDVPNLSLLSVSENSAVASLGSTGGTVAGTLPKLIFVNDATGERLRYIDRYDDGTFLTNVGLCELGEVCHMGGFTFQATLQDFSNTASLSARERLVAEAMMENHSASLNVALEVGASFSVKSAADDTLLVITEDGVVVAEGNLATTTLSVPPHVSISDMSLKNSDTERPELISKLSFRDFETYTEVDCFSFEITGPLQGRLDVAACEFSFSLSFDISELFSNFFFSFSFLEEDEATPEWDEQAAFSLFE